MTQVLDYRPDQGSAFVDLAPSLLIPLADLEATELLGPGSRATYSVLFAGTPAAVRAFKPLLAERKQEGERLIDVSEESPQIQSSSNRAGRFLNLSAMITVLLAAVAVAMAARRYTQRHLDNVAVMKCLGASQRLVLQVTSIELALIALIAAIVGSALGYLAQAALAWLLGDLVRADLPPPTLAPAILGAATSLAILVGFALPPMLQLKRVPPARVLRRNLEPPPLRYSVSYGLAVAALLGVLFWLVRDAKLVAYVAAGIAVTLAVLYGAGFLLVKLAGRLRGAVGVAWRYGLANLARRGRESVVQVVAFGLGLMVLLLLAVVRNDLLEDWRASLPENTPNFFMINIPADELEEFGQFVEGRGLPKPQLFPMIRARMTAINGRPIAELRPATDRGRGFAEREQNLSWAKDLQVDNEIVAGRWWREDDYGKPLVSVSTDYEEELGLQLGDKLRFDVAGRDARGRDRELPRSAVGQLPPELLPGLCAGHARRPGRHLAHQHEARQRTAETAGGPGAALSVGVGVRHRRDPGAGARRHRPRLARRAVRVPVHARGRHHRIAGGDPGDARRAPLRERDAAHARRPPARGARGRRFRVHRARDAGGRARRDRRDGSPAGCSRPKCSTSNTRSIPGSG